VENLEKIIKGCLAGKRISQEALYKEFSSKMYAVCLRYSGSEDEAADNLHDGFIKIFQNIKQYKFKGSFEGWIRRVMVNVCLEKFRKPENKFTVSSSEWTETDAVFNNVADFVSANELMEMIQKLPPRYKLVFNLYAIEGYTHQEIAVQLDITEGTSKSNLSRARTILQEKLNEIYFSDKEGHLPVWKKKKSI